MHDRQLDGSRLNREPEPKVLEALTGHLGLETLTGQLRLAKEIQRVFRTGLECEHAPRPVDLRNELEEFLEAWRTCHSVLLEAPDYLLPYLFVEDVHELEQRGTRGKQT